MKQITTSQEIILVPGASFFKRDWCEKAPRPQSKKLSQKEQLIQVCWNGLLPEILPEIRQTTQHNKQLTLWEVNESHELLDLRLGEFNESLNDVWSINPFVCIVMTNMN
ncbi:MAG: hypothetical protein EOO03_06880 [Chitinophagaceae bacterium]|nr:MAG: hypothetical protein EOO03_06880 [Chitinophagaceae bacterium]